MCEYTMVLLVNNTQLLYRSIRLLLHSASFFFIAMSGHAPGLPTVLKPTPYTVLDQVATESSVVFLTGKDADEPDTSKMLCS